MNTITKSRIKVAAPVAVALATTLTVGIASDANAASLARPRSTAATVTVRLSNSQQAEWARLTNTSAKRAAVAQVLENSFRGVNATKASPRVNVRPNLAYGYDGHAWITLSYADAARGLIKVGVTYCKTKLPGYICNAMGWVLDRLVAGWGWSSAHGVWGAAYWSGYVTGGRW